MSFISPTFLACLVPFVFLYYLVSSRWRPLVLVATAAVFYTAVSPWWSLLLAVETGVVFAVGRAMARPDRRRAALLTGGVVSLLAVLAFFKVAPSLHGSALASLALPLGISYYTFKLLSYLIEIYWGKLEPERDPIAFAAYVSFLPQLPTGPIQRPGDFLKQLRAPSPAVASGLRLVLFGLFQKVVVADRAAVWADSLFSDKGTGLDPWLALLGTYAYAIQLYADFAGITDIALGLGRIYGIEGPPNFRSPYMAESLPEFWRRWHMSLTTWITDYVFMPLRMLTRNWGQLGLAFSLMANMFLIALWHGATVPLLIFGVVHGLMMIAAISTKKRRDVFFKTRPRLKAARAVWRPVLTFHIVLVTLVLFRAPTLASAERVLGQVASAAGRIVAGAPLPWKETFGQKTPREDLLLLAFGLVVMAVARSRWQVTRWILSRPGWLRWSWYYAAVLAILFLGKGGSGNFIYAGF
jgi:D-alanyl-lipoteichoic acid acyltransferase DltB (MBOAT superfamily)